MSINTPFQRVLRALQESTGHAASQTGAGVLTRCPAHDDANPSLQVSERDDGSVGIHCHAGCSLGSVVAAVGLTQSDLFHDIGERQNVQTPHQECKGFVAPQSAGVFPTIRDVVETLESEHGEIQHWTYEDIDGESIGFIVRWDTPDGKQIRPLRKVEDGWVFGAPPKPRPLFGLPSLSDAERVYVAEGEKAAEALQSFGLIASTSSGGSNAVSKTDWSPLSGKDVVIVPDNDAPGRKFADKVSEALLKLSPPPTVRIVELTTLWPDIPVAGDAADLAEHFDAQPAETLAEWVENLAAEAAPVAVNVKLTAATVDGDSIERHLKYRCVADVEPVELKWLWPGKVPSGKLTLFAGDPGLGKSFVTIDMASRVSRGKGWPDQSDNQPAGSVIFLACEDDVADTVRPRLEQANADLDKVHVVEGVGFNDKERGFSLDRDLPLLQKLIDEIGDVRLLVVDPISAYCGKVDTHNNSEVRGLLSPLIELAASSDVAVVAINHLTKGNGNAVYRSTGSIAFVAAARSAWNFYKDPDDNSKRLILPTKMNLAPDVEGMSYSIEDGGVRWGDSPVTMSADEVQARAAAASTDSGSAQTALEEAVHFLKQELADGPVPSKQVFDDALAHGISKKTLRRAFNSIDGKPQKESGKLEGNWFWQLPEDDHVAVEVGQDSRTSGVGIFPEFGQLQEDDPSF
jgi:putative DNA primase/helicase